MRNPSTAPCSFKKTCPKIAGPDQEVVRQIEKAASSGNLVVQHAVSVDLQACSVKDMNTAVLQGNLRLVATAAPEFEPVRIEAT